jgi:hypothetical protein
MRIWSFLFWSYTKGTGGRIPKPSLRERADQVLQISGLIPSLIEGGKEKEERCGRGEREADEREGGVGWYKVGGA